MKKIIFLLMMMCIVFTGCKKDKAESELSIENDSIQTEMHSEAERLSTTTTAIIGETADSDTSASSQTSSSTSQTLATSVTTTTTEVSLDVGDALQKAVMDEEERAAIEAVQPSEQLNYYKDPILDFDREGYANLNIVSYGGAMPSSVNGANVHQYFFESKPMSGTDVLYLQKACEGYSGTVFDTNQVKSSTGTSLEDSECLTYENESAYFELHQDGTCMIYNKENISGILGQKMTSKTWTPLQGSKSSTIIYSEEEWDNHIFGADDGLIPPEELVYPLNGEDVSVDEARRFIDHYFDQGVEEGWISSLYMTNFLNKAELIEYENGSYGYYLTIELRTSETATEVDYREKTAYQNPDRAIKGQYIQVLMLSKDSADYISLPPTLTKTPDYVQTLPGTYCTLAEACEILSAYLSPDHVYEVDGIKIYYETVFLGELGIVQSPMWHLEVTSLTGEEAKYDMLYADIDLETKELYISYR